MCINTDAYPRRNSMSNGPVKNKMFPRRHSMTSSRPPRPSKSFNHTMAAMMIDTYEVDRVNEIMNNSQRRLIRAKSVSFDEVVMVRPVLPLADYTDQEIISSWYLPIEKQRMRAEIMNIIKVVKKKNQTSGKQFNVRGLEWLAEKDKTREKKRKSSIKEILNEQKAQREAHTANRHQPQQRDDQQSSSITYDFKQFRKVYRRHSRAAMQLAETMGKIDEMEGGNVQQPDMMMMMGHQSCSSLGSSGSRSTRSTRSTSSRSSEYSRSTSQRSISTKGAKSSRTRRGSRRFSLGSSNHSSSNGAPNEEFIISIP